MTDAIRALSEEIQWYFECYAFGWSSIINDVWSDSQYKLIKDYLRGNAKEDDIVLKVQELYNVLKNTTKMEERNLVLKGPYDADKYLEDMLQISFDNLRSAVKLARNGMMKFVDDYEMVQRMNLPTLRTS